MSKVSLFTQIKLFVTSHLVPVIAISAIVVVGATAGIVAIVMNSQKQDTEVATNTPTEDSENGKQEPISKDSDNKESDQNSESAEASEPDKSSNTSRPSEPAKPNVSQNQASNNNASTTQKPSASNNQTIVPSKPNTNQTQPSQPTTPIQPEQPSQPETPVEPEKPADNKIWGNPYIYKENGVYYCDRGNGFVKCEVPESWGCGFVEEPEPGYKPSKYGCYYVPEDFE